MAKTIKEERLRWVLPVARKEIRLIELAKVCPYGQRTLERWVSAYRKHGEYGLVPQSTRPKTSPKEISIRLKEEVLAVRRDTKDSALTLKYKLAREYIHIHERTIGKWIKAEGLTRIYRVRRIKYQYVRALIQAGDLIEIDVKYVPSLIKGKRCFQYTAIDVATRWRYLEAFDEQMNHIAIQFLEHVLARFPYRVKAIKTDNHPTFTNRCVGYPKGMDPMRPKGYHALDKFCDKKKILHYLIDTGKPQQNSHVERSHRTDQEHFYDEVSFGSLEELKLKLRLWNMTYNDRDHIGLHGKTPNEMLGYF